LRKKSKANAFYTAEFWEYDTRIGRRWNIDPKPRVGISDYSVMDGNPILLNDPDGDCPPGVDCKDPVNSPEISSDNGGKNNNRVEHGSTRGHKGVDIIAPKGTEIYAMMGGKVTVVNNHFSDEYSSTKIGSNKSPTTGLGNTVIVETKLTEDYTYKMEGGKEFTVKSGQTVFIKYSHLDVGYESLNGTTIKAGTPIGKAGATGNPGYKGKDANGNNRYGISPQYRHTHIESRIDVSFGKTVDPEGFMESTFDSNGNRNIPPSNTRNTNSKFNNIMIPFE
jgi:murein DD-endopeptidase MepM/ murein hydrolase activator NlpD